MLLGVHYANFTHPEWQQRLTERVRLSLCERVLPRLREV